MKSKYIMAIAITIVAIIGLLLYEEEERMAEGNFREGISFANLEIGDNLTISGVSFSFLGETPVNCDNFPVKAQEECKKAKFFAFIPAKSSVSFKVYQGHEGAYIALAGTPRYETPRHEYDAIVFSNNGYLCVDSPTGSYKVKYDGTFGDYLTRFEIETVFKKS